ncbi:hypothetical protein VP14_146 [Vibrio phage VPMCC14]|nr:hypothetical protein VP14_146 [Vibrio phage VPMCC14]
MKQFMNKVKHRWNVAPMWIKIIDITCWILLLLFIYYVL